MFKGLSALSLDSKGRFAIPVRYRELMLQDSKGIIVLTIDTESQCLLLYPLSQWEKLEAKIQELPSFDVDVRRMQRLLIGHATEIEMDGNGRILVPGVLREYASFQKDITLVGQLNKFEIWSDELWSKNRLEWIELSVNQAKAGNEVLRQLSI